MYYLSKLTGNYYLENNGNYTEVAKDDLDPSYILMMEIGNIQIVESLGFELVELAKPKVPQQLSRMKFKIQIRRSTIYNYDIILAYLQNLQVTEIFTQDDKQDIIDSFEDCTHFERYNAKFIMLANMLNVSDEIKDEIFIEGNKTE